MSENIKTLRERAERVHAEVCDVCYDHSQMNVDGTCRTCQDDLHEAEIWAR
jgi:hypothetical protein